MPKFSIKDLLITTTLVALGAAIVWKLFDTPRYNSDDILFEPLAYYIASTALIGTGLGHLVRRPVWGAIIGVFVAVPALFVVSYFIYFLQK
jgi:hypothetical protein